MLSSTCTVDRKSTQSQCGSVNTVINIIAVRPVHIDALWSYKSSVEFQWSQRACGGNRIGCIPSVMWLRLGKALAVLNGVMTFRFDCGHSHCFHWREIIGVKSSSSTRSNLHSQAGDRFEAVKGSFMKWWPLRLAIWPHVHHKLLTLQLRLRPSLFYSRLCVYSESP